ncbi:hypothetical protein HYS00_04015 [Candidatus Microgenomates bacterium]|nr:hypothetical protein [Candidatus Microgenomates bacterium]
MANSELITPSMFSRPTDRALAPHKGSIRWHGFGDGGIAIDDTVRDEQFVKTPDFQLEAPELPLECTAAMSMFASLRVNAEVLGSMADVVVTTTGVNDGTYFQPQISSNDPSKITQELRRHPDITVSDVSLVIREKKEEIVHADQPEGNEITSLYIDPLTSRVQHVGRRRHTAPGREIARLTVWFGDAIEFDAVYGDEEASARLTNLIVDSMDQTAEDRMAALGESIVNNHPLMTPLPKE